jgi:hypothetical protein
VRSLWFRPPLWISISTRCTWLAPSTAFIPPSCAHPGHPLNALPPTHKPTWLASSTLDSTLIAFITPSVSFLVAISSRVR